MFVDAKKSDSICRNVKCLLEVIYVLYLYCLLPEILTLDSTLETANNFFIIFFIIIGVSSHWGVVCI